MYRGTTPTISLTVTGISDLQLHSAYLTINQGRFSLEKTLDDMTINTDVLTVTLTQEETLKFTGGLPAKIQLRCLTKGGVAYATKIITVQIEEILKDGVIS